MFVIIYPIVILFIFTGALVGIAMYVYIKLLNI